MILFFLNKFLINKRIHLNKFMIGFLKGYSVHLYIYQTIAGRKANVEKYLVLTVFCED